MCTSKSPFSFVLLSLSLVNVFLAHLGIVKVLLAFVPYPKHVKAAHSDQLEKRDDTVFVERTDLHYIATVVTSSSNTFKLIVDTGSSFTWIGARQENPYVEGYASDRMPQTVKISYEGGRAQLRAITYRDLIILDGLAINGQEIGVAVELSSFPHGLDGILGLGPSRLNDRITEDGGTIPTVVNNLYNQGAISSPVIGIYFVPTNVENIGNAGLLSFGSVDTSVLTSDVRYVPITQTPPASKFWGVDASVAYGHMPILGPTAGFLDSGSRKIFIAGDAFMAYQAATGAVAAILDGYQRLTITQGQYDNLQTLSILIGGQSYDLSPNAQIYPRSSSDQRIVLVVHRLTLKNPRLGFILGSPFIERYYVVLNSSSSEIGFASHIHTQSTSN